MVLVALIGISSLKGTIEAIERFLGGAFSFSTEERTNSSELLFLGSMENFIRIVELADSSVEVGISRVTLYRDARSVRLSCQRATILSCIRLVGLGYGRTDCAVLHGITRPRHSDALRGP